MSSSAHQVGTVPFLECRGDHFSMGTEQGARFSTFWSTLDEELAEALGLPVAGQPGGAVWEYIRRSTIPPVAQGIGFWARHLLPQRLERLVPNQVQRISGLAEGSSPYGKMAFFPAMMELFFGAQSSAGCTTVAVSGQHTQNGEPLLVKNVDAPHSRLGTYLVRENRPDGLLADLDITDTGMAGCFNGLNQAGLAVSCNHRIMSQWRWDSHWVPPSLLCKELLERCQSVEQALDQVRNWPATRPCLLVLLDREGDLATVDVHTGVDIWKAEAGLAVVTNHGHGVDRAVSHWHRYLPWALGYDGTPSSHERYQRVMALLEGRQLSVEELKKALADHQGDPSDQTVCRHGERLSTRCSLVMRPAAGELQILSGTPCQGTYAAVSLSDRAQA